TSLKVLGRYFSANVMYYVYLAGGIQNYEYSINTSRVAYAFQIRALICAQPNTTRPFGYQIEGVLGTKQTNGASPFLSATVCDDSCFFAPFPAHSFQPPSACLMLCE